MSRGQRPRTVAEFPRMKDRAAGRRRRHMHVPDIAEIFRNLGRAFATAVDRSVFGAVAAAFRGLPHNRTDYAVVPPAAPLGLSRHDVPLRGVSTSLEIIDEVWHDPTHGQIDREIQDAVDRMKPSSLGQRVALERTAQDRKDRGLQW